MIFSDLCKNTTIFSTQIFSHGTGKRYFVQGSVQSLLHSRCLLNDCQRKNWGHRSWTFLILNGSILVFLRIIPPPPPNGPSLAKGLFWHMFCYTWVFTAVSVTEIQSFREHVLRGYGTSDTVCGSESQAAPASEHPVVNTGLLARWWWLFHNVYTYVCGNIMLYTLTICDFLFVKSTSVKLEKKRKFRMNIENFQVLTAMGYVVHKVLTKNKILPSDSKDKNIIGGVLVEL